MLKFLFFFLCSICLAQIPDENPEIFRLNPWLDGALLTSGLALQIGANYRLSQLDHSHYSTKELLPWDKPWAGTRSDLATRWSNYVTYPAAAVGLAYSLWEGLSQSQTPYMVQDLILLSEILTFNSALNLFVRGFGFWARPRYSHSSAPEEEKGEILGSFYSGHASAAFALATYYSLALTQRYGFSQTAWISALSFATASTVAWLRVEGGKHYPSDVVAGAVMGSGISAFFYWWRARDARTDTKKNRLGIFLQPRGIDLSWSF